LTRKLRRLRLKQQTAHAGFRHQRTGKYLEECFPRKSIEDKGCSNIEQSKEKLLLRYLYWRRATSSNAADIFVEYPNKQQIMALFDRTALIERIQIWIHGKALLDACYKLQSTQNIPI